MNTTAIINVPELSPAEEEFVSLRRHPDLPWIRLSGVPRNPVERMVKKPKLSRYRAAIETVLHTRRVHNPVVISHLPLMTAAVSRALRAGNARARHIGFAFNFTQLPVGRRLSYLQQAYRAVDRFVVFSEYEKALYASLFGLDRSRIVATLWTQGRPPSNDSVVPFGTPYLCAIGGEGRDFPTLLRAAKRSGVPLAVVCRPGSLHALEVPSNVRVFCNLPLAATWGMAQRSHGVVVPLLSQDTCCGQITLVSAQILGLPLITSYAHSSAEYLSQARGVAMYHARDAEGLAHWMTELMNSPQHQHEARQGVADAERRYARSLWADVLDTELEGLGVPLDMN